MNSDIGVIGMAVMGSNLALNLESRGFKVSIFNRSTEVAEAVAAENPEANLHLSRTLEDFVNSLKMPRKMILMVKAGAPVDAVIAQLLPLLDPNDIVIDGGNSFFKDSERRYLELKEKGFRFVGLGVSGGETGARFGPALMPGCEYEAYAELQPYLEAIAAKAEDGTPCSAWLGTGGAGHYVKMVHNGIEYADMQLISEIYLILKRVAGYDNAAIAETFATWNKGRLSSYLIEITAKIFAEKDPETEGILVDYILDVAHQKGTGKWTNMEAIDQGVDVSVLAAGLNARVMSMLKDERLAAERLFTAPVPEVIEGIQYPETTEAALLAAKVIAYAQGFSLYKAANASYHWDLKYDVIAANFRAGCIIRSTLLEPIMQAFRNNNDLPNLMLDPYFVAIMEEGIPALRKMVMLSATNGLPTPALNAALAYFDSYRNAQGSANLIQAQRDFFGAHTYERIDREGHFHHDWE